MHLPLAQCRISKQNGTWFVLFAKLHFYIEARMSQNMWLLMIVMTNKIIYFSPKRSAAGKKGGKKWFYKKEFSNSHRTYCCMFSLWVAPLLKQKNYGKMQEKFTYWWILLIFVGLGCFCGVFVCLFGFFNFNTLTHVEVMGKIGAAVAGLMLGQC